MDKAGPLSAGAPSPFLPPPGPSQPQNRYKPRCVYLWQRTCCDWLDASGRFQKKGTDRVAFV